MGRYLLHSYELDVALLGQRLDCTVLSTEPDGSLSLPFAPKGLIVKSRDPPGVAETTKLNEPNPGTKLHRNVHRNSGELLLRP